MTDKYSREALWAWASKAPEAHQKEGRRRAEIMHRVVAVADKIGMVEAFKAISKETGVSASTLQTWWYGGRGRPGAKDYPPADWPAVLIPRHSTGRKRKGIDEAAWEFFKADYLRLEKPSLTACYDRLKRVAEREGWTIPSIATLRRRLKAEVPVAVQVLAREGRDALDRLYPAQRRTRDDLNAMAAVNADGHRFDVFVRWPDGEIVRPTMVAWQDVYSGKILSWRIDKTENADAVRLAFGDMVERYGIPGAVYMDNGRGFASKWLTGGTPTRFRFKIKEEDPAGIITLLVGPENIHWTTPYHGQAKPIERAFRDLAEYVAKHPAFAGAYTGNNPTAKPENYGSKAVDLEDFLAVLEDEIRAHNAREGRRGGVCNGRSFDQVFEESYTCATITKATAEQRRLWLLAAEGVTVRRDATIALSADKGNIYWSDDLLPYRRSKVVVRFDPDHLHDPVYVYTLDGRYICQAVCVDTAGFTDTQAARDHNRARARWRRAQREQAKAELTMTAIEVTAKLPKAPEVPIPDARIVRPARPARDLAPPAPEPKLTAAEREAIERMRQEMAAEAARAGETVTEMDTPQRRYQRWCRIDAAIRAGQAVSDKDRAWHERYQRGPEFSAMRAMAEDFADQLNGSA